jgi:hypothetical protein
MRPICVFAIAAALAPSAALGVDPAHSTASAQETLRILRDELALEQNRLAQLRTPQRTKATGEINPPSADTAKEAAARRSEEDIAALEREIQRISALPEKPVVALALSSTARAPSSARMPMPPSPWWDVYERPLKPARHNFSADPQAAVGSSRPQ